MTRRHFYLVTDSPREDRVGGVDITETRRPRGQKNTESVLDKRNLDTGEGFSERIVSLGYYDFDSEEDYEERCGDVVLEKLEEVDESHLEAAGLDPEEVFDR